MSRKIKLNTKHWLIIIIIIGVIILVFYHTPNATAGFVILFLLVFALAFSAGAYTQLKAIRRMTDSPKSSIRGASQGNVELSAMVRPPEDSPHFELQQAEKKGYWQFSIKKMITGSKKWTNVNSFTSHSDYLTLYEGDTNCWVDLNFVDYYGLKTEEQFQSSELSAKSKKHAILKQFQDELADAQLISFEEEWLPSDKQIYGIGYFSSSPSSQPPSHLNAEDQASWLKIARQEEGIDEQESLKGIKTINTLTMSKFDAVSTPLVLSAYSESRLKRKVWFKFWVIIFSILVLLSIPVLYLLDQTGVI